MAAQVRTRTEVIRTPGVGGGPGPVLDLEAGRVRTSMGAGDDDIVPFMNGGGRTERVYTEGATYRGDTDSRQGLVSSKRSPKVSTKGLTRTDSGKSAHSVGALSFQNYDPKTTGSLSRSEEVTISMYEQTPPVSGESGSGHVGVDHVEARWSTDGSRAGGGMRGQVVREQSSGSTVVTTTPGTAQVNGDDQDTGLTRTVTETRRTGSTDDNLVTTTVTTVTKHSSSDAGSAKSSVLGDAGNLTSQNETKLTTTSATNSLDKTGSGSRPRKPGLQGSGGSFQIRSAYGGQRPAEPTSPAASDHKFKANLEESISRKAAKAAATKTQVSTKKSTSTAINKGQSQANKSTVTSGSREAGSSPVRVQEGRITQSGSEIKKTTESVVKTSGTDGFSRTESSGSQRARGSTDVTKRESTRSTTSTTSATDPGRPPSGRTSRLSRTSSTSESAPTSPRAADTSPVSSPTKRTESQKSTTSIKSSTIDRLAEPKNRKSLDGGRKSPGAEAGRVAGDFSISSKRSSVAESPSTKRSVVKRTEVQKMEKTSPTGSRSSSKESRSSSTRGTSPSTENKTVTTKVITTTVTKSDSARSGSTPGFAASTASSSAKRSESGRSSRASGTTPTSRASSSASQKGRFSMKSAASTSPSPPGSIFDVNKESEATTVVHRQSSTSTNASGKAKRTSSSSERKVTTALQAAAAEDRKRHSLKDDKERAVSRSSQAERTPSFTKAQDEQRVLSKSVFNELQSKRAETPSSVEHKETAVKNKTESEKVTDVAIIKPKLSSTETVVDTRPSREAVEVRAMKETIITRTSTSTTKDDSRPPSLLEKRRISRDSLTLDLSGTTNKLGKDGDGRGGTSSQQTGAGDGGYGGEGVISSAPVSPLQELQQTVKDGTVDRLVKGKFKGLNLTARFGDTSSLDRRAKEKSESEDATGGEDAGPKYKFPVEGIDIPASPTADNKGSLVEDFAVPRSVETSEVTVDHTEVVTTTIPQSTVLTKLIDDRVSEGGSLERAQKLKGGFTYLPDEKLARQVTARATTVTARRPHEVADAMVQEHKESTLEREKAEKKKLQAARAKLNKSQPIEKPTSPSTPGPEQKLAFSSVLRGVRDHQRNASDKKVTTDDTVIVNGSRTGASNTRDGGGQFRVRSSTDRQGHSAVTSVHSESSTSKGKQGSSAVQKSRVSDVKRSTSGNVTQKNTKMAASSQKYDARGRSQARKGAGGIGMSTGGDMGQLSPDSAYQSDSAASPGSDGKAQSSSSTTVVDTRDIKRNASLGVQPHEVTVQRVQQDATVAQGAHSRYESKRTVVNESKAANKTFTEPTAGGSSSSGGAQRVTRVNEYTTSQQTQQTSTYTDKTTPGGGNAEDDAYLVSTRQNETITKYATPTNEIPVGISSTATGSSASTYETSKTNFADRFKPADVDEVTVKRRSGPTHVVQDVTQTTTTTVKAANTNTELPPATRRSALTKKRADGSSVTAERLPSDVTSKQTTTTSSSTSAAVEGRTYLPPSEGGGVHLTIGPEPGQSSTDGTVHLNNTHELLKRGGQESPMRIENKENISRVMRESHTTSTTTSGYPASSSGVGVDRQAAGQLQSASLGSLEHSSASAASGGGRGRVIPLAPLTVDINTPNDSFEMATHPASVTSPTVKHTMTMFEMNEMTDGASGNLGRASHDTTYDGPYGGGLQHGGYNASRYASSQQRQHVDGGLDFQNLHNLRNTYQEQTLSSQQSYRSSPYDGPDSGGFDTVSRSFHHIPGSPSHPKYLRVDESRVGKMPMYRDHGISLRESGGSYGSGYHGGRHQAQGESYVSRAYVEGDRQDYHHGLHADPFDMDSVQSEPMYNRTRRSEKILAARRPIRRHASSTSGGSSQTLPPGRRVHMGVEPIDMGYHGHQTDGVYHSHRSHSTNMLYSPPGGARRDDGVIVSPELQDAKKRHDRYGDDQYHITVKLNQLNKGGHASVQSERLDVRDERYLQQQQHQQQHYRSDYDNMHTSTMSLPDMQYGGGRSLEVHEDYSHLDDRGYRYADDGYGSPGRTVTQLQLGSPPPKEQFEDRISWYRALRAQRESQGVSATDRYHSVVSNNSVHNKVPNDSDYAMNINQTMKMDYMPGQHEENHVSRHQETVYVNNVDHQSPSKSTVVISSDMPERRTMEERTVRTTRTYRDDHEEEEDLPQVVRGSILIKNRIDTTGAPKVIDVVADEYDDTFTVEDNTNVFQKNYLAVRENPMYNSDEDLSRQMERKAKPHFTRIFNRQDEEEYTEIPVDYKSQHSRTTKDYFVNSRDETDYGNRSFEEITERTTRTRGPPPKRDTRRSTEMEIARLIRNAPADSVKQRINVEREEEEIMGPLPVNHADGSGGDPSGMLNFDTISEKVDIGLQEGVAQLAVKVRCERIVPIRGVEDMFKKSSVIVTRLIEIDLGVTEERKRLYDNVMRGGSSSRLMLEGDGGSRGGLKGERKLGTKETFKLYKMFMGIAEAEEGRGEGGNSKLNIERRIEDEKRLPDGAEFDFETEGLLEDGFEFDENMGFDTEALDERLESQIQHTDTGVKLEAMPGGRGHIVRNTDPDTISYASQAHSEHSDMLF